MVEGTVFVEEGPPSTGFRCGGLEAGLRPRDPGGARFADANAQRFHYHVPKAPPEQSKGGSEWGTDDGHWHSRPLVHDDQNWVLLPGMSFDNFDDFLAGCEAYANESGRVGSWRGDLL
jgi:hypothetical protein